jgi:hypothetical protein
MGEAQRFCVSCGREIKPGGRFCTSCGRALGAETGVPVPAGPPAPPAPPAAPPAPPTFTAAPTGPSPWLPGTAPTQQWGPPPQPPPQPTGHKQDRGRWPVVAAVVAAAVLVVGGGTGAGLYFLSHSSHKNGAPAGAEKNAQPVADSHSASPPASSSPAAASSPATQAPSTQQAAQALAALLAKSVADRSSVVNAAADVSSCGPSQDSDAQVFQNAASSRQNLLSQLADLPGRASLPAPMLQALTNAWQASAQADQDLAQWAQDEASQGCIQNDHSDPGYRAATGPDNEATKDKKSFARQWNPLAAQYGLTPYTWNQL